MLHQPEHHRVVHRDLPLDSPLERQYQGADQLPALPHRILDSTIGLRLVRRGRLENSLHPEPLGDRPSQ
eukprot:9253696-Alexandrium_andersonii.AAC.1